METGGRLRDVIAIGGSTNIPLFNFISVFSLELAQRLIGDYNKKKIASRN